MRQIAFYGKGGVGKSTVGSNIAAALVEHGLTVFMVGCDPKHDCTLNLRGEGEEDVEIEIPTILDLLRAKGIERVGLEALIRGNKVELSEIIHRGYGGVYYTECGGPKPGVGCAGRGVIVAIDLLKRLNAFDILNPDVVIYDVPGDVVCGGFAMPLRKGLADAVYIVTSADYLAIYAANNICRGICEFANRGGSPLGGIIYNVRGMLDDEAIVREFAMKVGSRVIGCIPNEPLIGEAEMEGKTVIEKSPGSDIARLFRELAAQIYHNRLTTVPRPLAPAEMANFGRLIRKRIRERYRMGKG